MSVNASLPIGGEAFLFLGMAMRELKTSERCLIFYLDETGHEQFADPQCPIFGIGGCAILSMYCTRFLEEPWKEMKRNYFGDENIRLHATDLSGLTVEQMIGIGKFFRENLFSRLYTVTRVDSKIPDDLTNYKLVAESLLKRISAIASARPADSIALIFEDAQRTNILVERHFGSSTATRDDGEQIPIHKCFMKKDSGEIGLEVADFIIHTAGAQARQNHLKGKWDTRKDYESIFNNVPKQLVSVFEILEAKIASN